MVRHSDRHTRHQSCRRRAQGERRTFPDDFRNVAAGIAQADTDGRYLRVNGRFCEILGDSADELVGVRFSDITHPDERAEGLAKVARMRTGDIDTFSVERRYIRKDGTIVWCNLSIRSLRDAGGAVESSIGRDRGHLRAQGGRGSVARERGAIPRFLRPCVDWLCDDEPGRQHHRRQSGSLRDHGLRPGGHSRSRLSTTDPSGRSGCEPEAGRTDARRRNSELRRREPLRPEGRRQRLGPQKRFACPWRRRIRRDGSSRLWKISPPASKPRRRCGGGPPQGRVPGHARPRAAQPAGADPQRPRRS